MSIETNANGNIELKIKNKGLSYVIDATLDSELGEDVKLNKTEWNSVFLLIKSNQVTTNVNQFTDKDKDVSNYKHYVVNADTTYEIKQDVWNQIVEIGRNAIKRTKSTAEAGNTNTVPSTDEIKSPADLKETEVKADGTQVPDNKQEYKSNIQKEVLDCLKDTGYDVSTLEDDMVDALGKYYGTLKRVYPNMDDTKLKAKLLMYADGLKFHKFEKAPAGELETKASQVKTNLSDLRDAYIEMGEDSVAVYDSVLGGGATEDEIDLHEMFMTDLIDFYQTQKDKNTGKLIDANTARKYADEVLKEYINQTEKIDLNNVSKDKYKAEIFNNALRKMQALDLDGSGTVSPEEMAVHQYNVAHLFDGSNKISADEMQFGKDIIASFGLTKEEIMKELHCSEEKAELIIQMRTKYDNNKSAYASFIIDGKIPS